MLSSAVRPSAQLAQRASSCALCALTRSTPRTRSATAPLSSRAAPARIADPARSLHKRGTASLAQAGDRVDVDDDHHSQPERAHHDHPPVDEYHRDIEEEGRAAEQAMVTLIDELAEHQRAARDAANVAASSPSSPPSTQAAPSAPTPADPTPSSSSSSSSPPEPPAPENEAIPAAAELTLKTLLKPSLPHGGPTLDDLRALRPKRFTIPEATSPDSHRLVYRKSWEAAYHRFDRAFNKRQLADFAGPYGLDLDLTDPRLRTGTKGKKQKFWKSKRIDQMTKRELIQTILVLEFHMVDPETIPSAKSGPRMTECACLRRFGAQADADASTVPQPLRSMIAPSSSSSRQVRLSRPPLSALSV